MAHLLHASFDASLDVNSTTNGTANATAVWSTDEIAAIVDISISVPLFTVLLAMVLVMVISRFCGAGQSAVSPRRKKRQSLDMDKPSAPKRKIAVMTPQLAFFFAALTIFAVVQLAMSIVFPLAGLGFKLYTGTGASLRAIIGLLIVAYIFICIYYVSYLLFAASFFLIWSQASIVYDLMVTSGSKKTAASAAGAVTRGKVLRAVRITTTILAILAVLVGTAFGIAVTVFIILMVTGDMTPAAALELVYAVIIPGAAVTLVLFACLVSIPAVLLATALRRSNAILKQQRDSQTATATSTVGYRNTAGLRKRIAEQKLAIRKLSIALIVFLVDSALFIVGLIVYSISLTNRSIPGYIIDLVLMRVLPSSANILMALLLFWPWQIPRFLLCMLPEALVSKKSELGLSFESGPETDSSHTDATPGAPMHAIREAELDEAAQDTPVTSTSTGPQAPMVSSPNDMTSLDSNVSTPQE